VANNNNKNGSLTAKKGKKPLCKHTEDALDQYFTTLNGDRPGDLYDLVIGEVERPLFKAVNLFSNSIKELGPSPHSLQVTRCSTYDAR